VSAYSSRSTTRLAVYDLSLKHPIVVFDRAGCAALVNI
jgi:hypothetical protein